MEGSDESHLKATPKFQGLSRLRSRHRRVSPVRPALLPEDKQRSSTPTPSLKRKRMHQDLATLTESQALPRYTLEDPISSGAAVSPPELERKPTSSLSMIPLLPPWPNRTLTSLNSSATETQSPSRNTSDRENSFPTTTTSLVGIPPSGNYPKTSQEEISRDSFANRREKVHQDEYRADPQSSTWSGSTIPPLLRRTTSTSGFIGNDKYHYGPLRHNELRLVRILPARSSKVSCEIVHASIDDAPDFVAISYAWGDADDTRKVMVHGVEIYIAVSLWGALRALRQKKADVLVWADALCIDQQNREERTQQVQLMTIIYSRAKSVAIWLGPEADDSNLATKMLEDVAEKADSPDHIADLILSGAHKKSLSAIVALFERDYWKRLWVVQEIFSAQTIWVYCGTSKLHWNVYQVASNTFWHHSSDIDTAFPGDDAYSNDHGAPPSQFTPSQVLAYQGPSSIPDFKTLIALSAHPLLEIMRTCRAKLSADARDKVFAILGLLPDDTRAVFPVNYRLSVKEVYVNVVDHLIHSTDRLDVLCESIHFPLHTNSANLPSWAPDWSHIPETPSLGRLVPFSASGDSTARYAFVDERRKELRISAVFLDSVRARGVAVGTLCTLSDYLMAFVHWRALLRGEQGAGDAGRGARLQEDFCRTLCFDQVPGEFAGPGRWVAACYHVFASLMRERLPSLEMDGELGAYVGVGDAVGVEAGDRRAFLQNHFGSRMMGRCLCLGEKGLVGMGSGFMAVDDLIVVPLGCSTPILVRQEGRHGRYRFVGDVYVHGYMHGEAVSEWEGGSRELREYVLH